jgi:RND family efflux transporter MFP subunit
MNALTHHKNPPNRCRLRNSFWIPSGITVVAALLICVTAPLSPSHAQKPDAAKAATDKGKGGEKSRRGGGDKAKSEQKGRRGGSGRRGGRGRPAAVLVDAVKRGVEVETVQVYGRVIASQTGVIAARTRGAIGTIEARVGDRVKKGDVLVTLVSNMLDSERALKAAELKEFNAKIRTAGAELGLAAQELERLERLRKSAAFSVARYQDKLRDVERFKSALAEARAKSDQAQAELRMADINLHNAKIRAPYDGVISARHVEVGNYVSVGARVMTILNDTSLEVEAEVPANRLGGLTPGASIKVLPEHGRPYGARVRAVVPEENALSRTRLVRFTPIFTEREESVAANQSVILHIPSGAAREAITVHKDAITQRRGKRVVFVVQEDDEGKKRAAIRSVELGEAFGERFEVIKGLQVGDSVVVRGNERLRPRQEVRIQSARGGRGGKGRRGGGKRSSGERGANGKRGGS